MIYLENDYVSVTQEETEILTYLDNKFVSFIPHPYTEYTIPSLIDQSVLVRTGYFASFPNQIMAVTGFKQQEYGQISDTNYADNLLLEEQVKYLTPAACLHVYPILEKIQPRENTIITLKASVYRNEKKCNGLTRLSDFTVREIVLVGNRQFIVDSLESFKDKALCFALEISADATLVRATDHFYPNAVNAVKARLQKANNQKYELRVPIQQEDIALSSFNFHDTHFSKAFHFEKNGEILTGCIGFGLERWLAAVITNNYSIGR